MRIGSWNTEQRLTTFPGTKRGTPERILNEIERLNQDILVLPEAFQERPDRGVDDSLRDMGYRWWVDARYEDKGRETAFSGAMPYMRILSRHAIQASKIVRFGDLRNTAVIEVDDPETDKRLRVAGIHWRDDNESMRLTQIEDFIRYYQNSPEMPTIAIGDWNAMHGEDIRAKVLGSRAVRFAARHMPEGNMQTVAERLTDMATGTALTVFEQGTYMRELDPKHRPTTTPKMRGMEWMPSIRTVQIDHAYSNDFVEASSVSISDDGGADHRAIGFTARIV